MQWIVTCTTGTWSKLRNAFLKHKFLILDIYLLGNLYLREGGHEDPWLFFEAKKKKLEKY